MQLLKRLDILKWNIIWEFSWIRILTHLNIQSKWRNTWLYIHFPFFIFFILLIREVHPLCTFNCQIFKNEIEHICLIRTVCSSEFFITFAFSIFLTLTVPWALRHVFTHLLVHSALRFAFQISKIHEIIKNLLRYCIVILWHEVTRLWNCDQWEIVFLVVISTNSFLIFFILVIVYFFILLPKLLI